MARVWKVAECGRLGQGWWGAACRDGGAGAGRGGLRCIGFGWVALWWHVQVACMRAALLACGPVSCLRCSHAAGQRRLGFYEQGPAAKVAASSCHAIMPTLCDSPAFHVLLCVIVPGCPWPHLHCRRWRQSPPSAWAGWCALCSVRRGSAPPFPAPPSWQRRQEPAAMPAG